MSASRSRSRSASPAITETVKEDSQATLILESDGESSKTMAQESDGERDVAETVPAEEVGGQSQSEVAETVHAEEVGGWAKD